MEHEPIVRFKIVHITVSGPSFWDSSGSRTTNFDDPFEAASLIASSTRCWSSASRTMVILGSDRSGVIRTCRPCGMMLHYSNLREKTIRDLLNHSLITLHPRRCDKVFVRERIILKVSCLPGLRHEAQKPVRREKETSRDRGRCVISFCSLKISVKGRAYDMLSLCAGRQRRLSSYTPNQSHGKLVHWRWPEA